MASPLPNPHCSHQIGLHLALAGLVSVITPSHNEVRFLRRVVESVAAQTVPVFEHIIIDDGSEDHTWQQLHRLQAEYSHLVVLRQARRGAAAARNAGIAIARGRYIAFLDADDVWHEHKVERQVAFMEEHQCAFSYGDYVEVDYLRRHPLRRYRLPATVGHEQLLRGCPIGCLTVAYNQEVLGKRYMPEVASGHDWGLWLNITRDGVRAHKYPGVEASYSNGRPSLSSRKLRKIFNIYQIYRSNERLGRARSLFRVAAHALAALFKKMGLIYR